MESSEQCSAVGVGGMDEDELVIFEPLQHLHPHVRLVGVGGNGAEEGHVDVLEGRDCRCITRCKKKSRLVGIVGMKRRLTSSLKG